MAQDSNAAGLEVGLPELSSLRHDFPRYRISLYFTPGERYSFVAVRRAPGPGPHTVVTSDLDELRTELGEPAREAGSP